MFGRKRQFSGGFAAVGDPRVDRSYDVVIIGSGAGGATLAQRLGKAGKSVLILERGDRLPIEEQNWDANEVFLKQRYRTDESWRDRRKRRFKPTMHYWVGGNTSFYGGALLRYRQRDFEAVAHAGGLSPAWPISYTDLKPYYHEAEVLWDVHGTRGSDPTDDADAPPYPHPAIEHDAEVAVLKQKLEGEGWSPFDLPLGIDRNDAAPWRGRCARCTTCGGFPCLTRGKSDARRVLDIIETTLRNVTLEPRSRVLRLETDPNGRRVTAVVYERDGEEQRVRGDVVILAAGAANSAAILLKSANSAHPRGLANGSDQVGRNYMFHTLTAVLSATLGEVTATFPKTFGINDFYWGDKEGGFDFPMGHIQLLEYMNPDAIRGQLSAYVPPWAFPRSLAKVFSSRFLAFLVISEDLPQARNRIRVDRSGGIVLHYWYNNLKGHKRLVNKFQDMLQCLGRLSGCASQHRFQFSNLLPLFGTAHQQGTLRMGVDPENSVVDPFCRAHEIENLYVGDTSVFVSSAAVNPTLTLVANGLRIGDHLVERMA